MKRLCTVIILLVLALSSYANSIDRRIQALLDDLAKKYLLTQDTLVSKKTVTLVEIKNISPVAAKNFVGEAVAERIKAATQDSLVFTYVDRELLEEALEEIELSLSDFSEGSTVEVGRIEEVELLLSGSIIEEGEDFLVTLQLVDVETTTLVAVSKTRFAVQELVEVGSQYAYTYITANGIGTSLLFSPAHFLVYPAQAKVRHGDDIYHAFAMSGRFSYRLSRRWKVGLDVSFSTHDVYYGSLPFSAVQNVPQEGKNYANTLGYITQSGNVVEVGDPDYNAAYVDNIAVNYSVNQQPLSFSLPFAYVHSFGNRLNISAGLGPTVQLMHYQQVYDSIPVLVGDLVAIRRKEISMWFVGLGAQASLELEYFFLPRIALNVGGSFLYAFLLPQAERQAHCTTSGEWYYSRNDFSYEAFLLDPFQTINGEELDENLYNHGYGRLYAGISMYF
jgi:TolB-like protein